jgi:hypothetical protein
VTPEAIDLFERLYYNETGLTDKFVNYWKAVANKFANNKFVIGYDPLNEPFPSNFLKNTSLVFEPGLFDKVGLEPIYSRIFKEAYEP